MKKNSNSPRGYLYLKLFIFFVVVLAIGLGVIRLVKYYQDRSFTTNSYITLYSNGVRNYLVSYHSPNSYVVAELKNEPDFSVRDSGLLEISLSVGVPVDGVIVDEEMETWEDIFSLSKSFKMILDPGSFVLRNFNAMDSFKYFFLKREVSDENRDITTIDYSHFDEAEVSDLFRDEEIFNNAVSIQVVNGTKVSGLGSTMSEVLLNRGYNVVSVTNSSTLQEDTYIATGGQEESQTALSLKKLFPYKRDVNTAQVADISIVLGEDTVRK